MPGGYIPGKHDGGKHTTPMQTFIWLTVILVPITALFCAGAPSVMLIGLPGSISTTAFAGAQTASAPAGALICFALLS
jgi:hypothetical protein